MQHLQKTRGEGSHPSSQNFFLFATFPQSVPLQPNAFGATIRKGAGILCDPGKQLRSPRCLRVRERTSGTVRAWSPLQVVPGSSVLKLDLSRVARGTASGVDRFTVAIEVDRLTVAMDTRMLVIVGPERPAVSDWASALSWGRDEAELVHELQAGSETAFDWLVTHYHAPVYNLILGMLGDTSDSADGSQEVFLKAFRRIPNFRHGSSLKTWLYRIAIPEALNHKRWFKELP